MLKWNSIGRLSAILLLLFVGLLALYGAWVLMSDPSGDTFKFSLDLLKNTPFHNYFIPGLILFIFIGVFCLFTVVCIIAKAKYYPNMIVLEGIFLFGWLSIELLFNKEFFLPILHYPLYGISSILILIGLQKMKINKKIVFAFGIIIGLIILYLIIDSFLFNGVKPVKVKNESFQANFYSLKSTKNKAAFILIGGGQWGDYWGVEFAKNGYSGLSLPYTRLEGLPVMPEEIPLEYYKNAIRWLGEKEEVDPTKIIVMGASRNAELALVIASTFPELVHGVIAYAPGSVSWSNTVLPYNSDDIKASWTYNEEAIPYIPMEKIVAGNTNTINTLEYWESGLQKIDQFENAMIKVEDINGPILLFSGKEDEVWPSALMADQIEKRLEESNFGFPFQNIQYENAGHLISGNPELANDTSVRTGTLYINDIPYEFNFGGTMEGDNKAKKDAKKKVFDFIQKL